MKEGVLTPVQGAISDTKWLIQTPNEGSHKALYIWEFSGSQSTIDRRKSRSMRRQSKNAINLVHINWDTGEQKMNKDTAIKLKQWLKTCHYTLAGGADTAVLVSALNAPDTRFCLHNIMEVRRHRAPLWGIYSGPIYLRVDGVWDTAGWRSCYDRLQCDQNKRLCYL